MTREFCDACKREVVSNDRLLGQDAKPVRLGESLNRFLSYPFPSRDAVICLGCYNSLRTIMDNWFKKARERSAA